MHPVMILTGVVVVGIILWLALGFLANDVPWDEEDEDDQFYDEGR